MPTRRAFTVAALCALTFATPAHAERHAEMIFRPHPTFENILPDGFAITDAPPVDAVSLRDKKVALIPSENLNGYAAGWMYYNDRAAAGPNWFQSAIGGVTTDSLQNRSRASDPRHVTDAMIDLIRPYFGEVIVAQDLPSARAQGADYFIILDCRMSAPALNTHFRFDGGVYLLDASLHRVLEATGFGEVSRGGLLSNPLTQDPIAMDQSMTTMIAKVSDGVHARLGPPPAPAPLAAPQN
jgi:hypothetical protein